MNKKRIGIIASIAAAALIVGTGLAFVMPRLMKQLPSGEPSDASEGISSVSPETDGPEDATYPEGISWYDIREEVVEIDSAEKLKDLSDLSFFFDFKGQTLRLTKDIVFNDKDAASFGEERPENIMKPIRNFAGTFDGQGHTISGMFLYGSDIRLAMFINASETAVIKDLSIKNSMIKAMGGMGAATFTSGSAASLQRLYSDAILEVDGGYVAGIASQPTGGTLSECWFDGIIVSTKRYAGGIVDSVPNDVLLHIDHCLYTGEIHNTWVHSSSSIGGIVGCVQTRAELRITDCFSDGSFSLDNTVRCGSILGGDANNGTSSSLIDSCFASLESFPLTVSTVQTGVVSNAMALKRENLIGLNSYRWTMLDFERYWTTAEETPRLQCFSDVSNTYEGVAKVFSTDWFDEASDTYILKTPGDLYGFAYLSGKESFEGKTVKLANDIIFNENHENYREWLKEAPEMLWVPIGNQVVSFEGTFDGGGHTIYGIYCRGGGNTGLFAATGTKAVIRNLNVKNAMVLTSGDQSGIVAGIGNGTFDTIFCSGMIRLDTEDAVNGIGGIIGSVTEGSASVVNCWFDGEVDVFGVNAQQGGGVVGNCKNSSALSMSHCLNTGTVRGDRPNHIGNNNLGGLIGFVADNGTFYCRDSLAVGKIEHLAGGCASAFGHLGGNAYTTVQSTYALMGADDSAIDTNRGTLIGIVEVMDSSFLNGYKGYQWTDLDFENYWAVDPSGPPVLRSFVSSVPPTDGYQKMFDMDWYDPDEEEYVITTRQQLIGLSKLSKTNTFEDKTIFLGDDIVINGGSAENYAFNAPSIPFAGIGSREKPFQGIFDGKGHIISGIYSVAESDCSGLFQYTRSPAVIKDLRLKNSYFESAYNAVGSIAGDGGGEFTNISSEAILNGTKSAHGYGGIVGRVNDGSSAEISFSWFSGRITVAEGSVTQQHGGILGQVLNDASVEINHCLFTGSIHADRTYGAANVGGILGIALGYKYGDRIWKPYVTISDCFADGTIEAKGGLDGAILGQSGAESHVAIRNSYGTRETSPLLVGGVNAHKNDYSEDGAVYPAGDITGAKAYAWLDLDFERVWACTALTPRLRIVTPSDQFVTTEGIAKIDTSWYDKNSSVFTIVNAEQLRSLKKVSGSEDFENKTIKLGADILLNEDWENYASYGTAPPENVWEPLYSPSRPFRGTFDGQGHAIKGLFIRSDQEYTGLFAEAWGTFRNLRFVNGWIECTGESRLGVIAGRASGTFEQIYTNCILKGAKTTDHYFIGGLVGQVTWNDSVFREVWSEVQIDMKNANAVGGIIGAANANKNAPISVEIRDCLFTGSIRIDRGAGIGGFVGQIINNNDVVTMTVSCGLSAGELFVSSDGSGLGSIVGMVGGSQKTDVERTYYVKGSAVLKEAPAGGIGSVSGTLSGTYAEREKENLCGVSGYDNTMLDFTNVWAAVENDVPHLRIFTDGFELIDVSERERFDTSWYDPAADSYWIRTAEQLKYLAEQSKTADFNGKAIILTDDIVFNTDHASYLNYGESAPKRVWPVFGSDSLPFAGTIEGGGHTIYGLYASAGAGEPTGFISRMAETAKVRNLKILDAYFETAEEKKGIGVLSGIASGTIDRVYIDAILKTTGGSTYVGGIAGLAEHLSVSGTTFAGTVKGTNEKSIGYGGLIGGIDGTTSRLTLTDVCFSGEVSLVKRAAYLGGLIGRQNAGKAEITGALVSGSVVNEKSNGTHTGSVFGYVRKNDMKAKNVYAVKGAATTSVLIGNGSVDGGVTELPESSLLGTNAKTSTGLDFEAHWETVEAGLPILQPIKECDLSPDIADTRWFDPSMTTYTLRTINELIGLSKLSEFNDFGGKVIRLANDLVLNEDHKNFASWGGTAPKYSFTPIGAKTYAASASNGFKGTFDGQGHAIMGLYTKTAEDMRGGLFNITKDAVIKNVRLVDCYFESSGTERFGAFAGIGSGTFENLYTNAVVNSTYADAYSVAGFVGQGWGLTFRNCWFDGRVVKKGSACAAAFVGMTTEAEPILIENCLVTGTAETDLTASGANLAGFLAYSFNRQSSVTIKNSLFAGKVLCAELTENSGSVIGRMDRPLDSELLITLENVYAVENGAGNSRTIGTAASEGVIISGSVTEVPLSSILGDSASSALPGLDFTVFYPRENDVPGLNP